MDAKVYGENTVPGRLQKYAYMAPFWSAFGFLDAQQKISLMTREQLWNFAQRFSSRILQWGFQKGGVICNTLPNSRTRLITDMGIMTAGMVALNGNVFLKDEEDILMSFRQSSCKMVIIPSCGPAHDIFSPYLPKKFREIKLPIGVTCHKAPSLKYILVIDADNKHKALDVFLEDLDLESIECTYGRVEEDDPAFIFTTCGTTSLPKLVLRSHRELMSIGGDLVGVLMESDSFFNDRPLGLMGGFPFEFLVHGTLRIIQERPGTDQLLITSGFELWQAMADKGVTAAQFMPSEIDQYMEAFVSYKENFKPKLLRIVLTGGEPVKRPTYNCIGVLTRKLYVVYSSTEVGLVCCSPIVKDNKDSFADSWVGTLDSGKEIRIKPEITESPGSPSKDKTIGRLLLKGPNICDSYYDFTMTPTQSLKEDGWFDTGDVGYMNKDPSSELEYLHVTGRSCDTIRHDGVLIYPSLLEELLLQCPGVADAAVAGYPNPVRFRDICAFIIPDKDSVLNQEIVAKFCHEKYFLEQGQVATQLPGYYFFMTNFPQTDTGKLSRTLLTNLITAHVDDE